MDESRAEMHDLAARHPDLVRRMAEQWNRWAASSYVDPWSEAYDIWIRENPPRQNWGASETPQRPDAMNAMTDTLARTLKARFDAKPLPDVPVVPD
jgi:arylsulfatase